MRYLSTNKRIRALSDLPSVLLTLAVCLMCWIAGYVYSTGFPLVGYSAVLPLWGVLCKLFVNKICVYLAGLLIIIIVAFAMQRISDRHMLIRERTRLPFILFILLVSTNSGLLPFKEVTIVLLCLVFMIYELFDSYQSPEETGMLFNAGVLVGIAGLFMPQVLWLIPLLWIGMYQFRSLSFRSFAASLMGVLIIYWFVLAWCIWKHDFSTFSSLFSSIMSFDIISPATLFQYYRIGFAGVVLLLVMSFFHIKSDALSNSVRVRMMLSFLLNMSTWSLIKILLYGNNVDSFFALLYLPVSVLAAYFFENIRYYFRFSLYYSMLILWSVSFIIQLWNF